jgi:oligopeptide transport system substrate-binding protein
MFRTRSAPGGYLGALRFCAGVLLILLGLFAGGCAIEDPADLRIINGKEPESLDPATVIGQADGRVVQSVFEGLTRYNPTNATPEPGLARAWEISPDGKSYTFFLRTNAQWSTGGAITAHDVVYSWFRVLDPMTAADYVGNLFYVRGAENFHLRKNKDTNSVGIEALDDYTLRVELINPTPFFLDLCAFGTFAVVPRATIEKHGDQWLKARPLPSSGPYQLASWRLNDRIRLKKNPRYWDAANVTIETADFLPISSQNTAINLFVNGEVDIIWDKEVIPTELVDILSKRKDFHTFDYLGNYFVRINVTRPPFNDVRVRKALALAMDRSRIANVLIGSGKVANHFVPPGLPNYTSPNGLEYDPPLARQLLGEAGFPAGKGFPPFEYLFNSSRDHEKIAVELQDIWKRELGIQMELRAVEWKVYLNGRSSLDYDLCRNSWIGDYTDPNTFLDLFLTTNPNNQTGWKSERYDSLLRTANATADVHERARLMHDAEAILIREELPVIPIYIYVGYNMFDPKVIHGIYNENNPRDEHPLRAIRKTLRPKS